jgi:glyoxylase-like metal-dependent hydrolase (beta-lactamase superfamily II)
MPREPYHILDPVFARTPFPWSERFETERVGGVQTLRMARLYGGHELMGVYCYAIGDTLVDTGLACYARQMRQYVSENGIRRALVTHHHEDHAGNASTLSAAGRRGVFERGLLRAAPRRPAHPVLRTHGLGQDAARRGVAARRAGGARAL